MALKKNQIKTAFEDLGFSAQNSLRLKIKADIFLEIIKVIKKNNYTSRQLERILDQPQPRVSELMNGKISKVSIEKLLDYLDTLGKEAIIKFHKKAI